MNDRLLQVAKEEKQKRSRKKGKNCGYGRVMGIEVIEEREQEAGDRQFLKFWKEEFCKLGPELFAELPKPRSPCKKATKKTTRMATRKEKEKEKALEAMMGPLPVLDPRLFEANLQATSPTKAKGKRKASEENAKPRKKAKEVREEETMEVEVRTRVGRPIKRTSKVQKRV
jgi:hypothetical protein